MEVEWPAWSRSSSQFARGASLAHAHCPLEQLVRSDDAKTQADLMREPWFGARREGVLPVGDCNALRLLGRSEAALDAAVDELRGRFGQRLAVEPPNVRRASGTPPLEPWMSVLAIGPQSRLLHVRADFLRRRGRILRIRQSDPFVLEGEAPLAQLLGYAKWLREAAATDASLALNRYLPEGHHGPEAA